ncbi:hypothetical protein [Rubrolithibacter danxiaensis]|uniref:hypothetical protein n=1 Tax=Rubrolithibacter danxiaensis TaxID=3390805 RepID=UPI003BF86978
MGQILTINLNKSHYQFQVLKLQQTGQVIESQILLQGSTVTLCKETNKGWIQKDDSDPIVNDLVKAIGNSISLRYRV